MKRAKILLAALALLLVIGVSVPSAMAYFTAYTEAQGAQSLTLAPKTTFEETEVQNWTKHLVMQNTGESPVYVRARAFAGSEFTLTYSGNGWSDGGDGYWYYGAILEAGQSSEELLVAIGNIPQDVKEGDGFNVAVVYEATPVRYDENGNPYADWSVILDVEP